MATQKKELKPLSISTLSTTERINVTDLTLRQRRELFIDYVNQNGFKGFIKNDVNKQTYFVFCYDQ